MADDFLLDADLAGLDRRLRELEPVDLDQIPPPASVWAGIERSLSAERPGDGADHVEPVRATDRRPVHRSRASSWVIGLAAATVLAVAGAVVVVQQASGPDTVATAQLTFQPGFDELGASAAATAELTDEQTVVLADADLPADLDDADLELWLIEPAPDGSVASLVSLGTIDGDRFAVPAGYDTDRYSVVDISIEPRDGDPAHSGRSILRGSLEV